MRGAPSKPDMHSRTDMHGSLHHTSLDSRAAAPGDAGVWLFVLADMATFAVFFALFAVGQAARPDLYAQSRAELNAIYGLANTLILLTSGAAMAAAVRIARHGEWAAARRAVLMAMAIGSLFAVSKAIEWSDKLQHDIGLTTNAFFTYYFVLTGIHFVHFIIGIVVLAVLASRIRTDAPNAAKLRWLEAGGAYWHMVDLLWVALFAMLYLANPL